MIGKSGVGKSGYWETAWYDVLIGRNLECGRRTWWRKAWDRGSELAQYYFHHAILRKNWTVTLYDNHHAVADFYDLNRRQAAFLHKTLMRGHHWDRFLAQTTKVKW